MESKKYKLLIRRVVLSVCWAVGMLLLVFLGLSFIPLTPTVPPIQPRADTQYWNLLDGHKIAYTKIEGDALDQNPPIIFLHGGPGGYIHSSIIEQMRILAQSGYDIYLYDQIGSGLSDRLDKPKDYSFYRHVRDLKEIVTSKINTPKVIIIGQSFGSQIAAYFIAEDPQLVEKVIFTSPGPLQPLEFDENGVPKVEALYPTPPDLHFIESKNSFQEAENILTRPRIIMTNISAMLFNVKWASDRELDGVVNSMAETFTSGMVCDPAHVLAEEGGGGGYVHIFSNWYADVEDPRQKLAEVDVPALVLQGQCDQNEYPYAFEYAALLHGEYVFMEGAGHEIWWEQSKAFRTIILKFLEN